MQLYVLRHGDAPFDAAVGERVLSAAGETDVATIANARRTELLGLSHVICSPSRRARETLAVLQRELPLTAELIIDDCLRSESSVAATEAFIDNLLHIKDVDNLLLISHQPLVGSLYRFLLDRPDDFTFLGTANLVAFNAIAFARGCAELQWLDTP